MMGNEAGSISTNKLSVPIGVFFVACIFILTSMWKAPQYITFRDDATSEHTSILKIVDTNRIEALNGRTAIKEAIESANREMMNRLTMVQLYGKISDANREMGYFEGITMTANQGRRYDLLKSMVITMNDELMKLQQ